VNDGGKTEKPQPKPIVERAPSLARKIAEFQGEPPTGVQGMAATHAHKQKYFRGVEYRFSDGAHGEPPLANLAHERGAPVREHAGREQNARLMRKHAEAGRRAGLLDKRNPEGRGGCAP